MSELTKEYFDQQFEELLRAVKEGFDATASKEELKRVQEDVTDSQYTLGQLEL